MGQRGGKGRFNWILWILVSVQILCTGFFIWDIGYGILGIRQTPLSWQVHEMIEIGAALGLILGLALGTWMLVKTLRRNAAMESQLRAASGAFAELLEERFAEWGLTPAERDVAWFTLKGFSNAEIAGLRETSEGTVKAQSYAIYRKAGVSGRTQLLSMFIEDLLDDERMKANAAQSTSPPVIAAK